MKYRVVVDTNIWISFLIGKRNADLLDILDNEDVELVSNHLLLQEMREVTSRHKFRKYFTEEYSASLIEWLSDNSTFVELPDVIPCRCRDRKDDYLLELAICSKALYLVSGDDDLLSIGEIEGCKIMTVRQLKEALGSV